MKNISHFQKKSVKIFGNIDRNAYLYYMREGLSSTLKSKTNKNMNISQLSSLSVSELRNINQIVVELIKQKRNIESLQKKVGLQIGMMVRVNHPKLRGVELSINKINRTKATVSVRSGATYIVPISLIEY